MEVKDWSLSEIGRQRIFKFSNTKILSNIKTIWSSNENKAIETAQILSTKFSIDCKFSPCLGENDRSSTGFLLPVEFEETADLFFHNPNQSIRGWETAKSAQERIVSFFLKIEKEASQINTDIVIVSHGAVGTLLYCALNKLNINRIYDQSKQGSYWIYCTKEKRVLQPWKLI